MRLRRRRKVLAWGTFCPVCRTVYAYPRGVPVCCYGDYRNRRHESAICDVVTVFR